MSAQIITMPITADAAWSNYQRLVKEREAEPSLWGVRPHVESVIRAHKVFEEAFLRECGQ